MIRLASQDIRIIVVEDARVHIISATRQVKVVQARAMAMGVFMFEIFTSFCLPPDYDEQGTFAQGFQVAEKEKKARDC